MAQQKETYGAIVTNTDDPLKRGRIRCKSVTITGDTDTELPDWIDPAFDWGWFVVPDVGEEIELEAVVSDDQNEETYQQAFLEEPRLRWKGTRFQSDGGEAPRPPNSLFTATNYGKRRGFATPGGHVIMFDDTPGKEQVLISWKKNGANEFAFVGMDSDGSVQVVNKKGSLLYLDAKNEAVVLIDQHGNSLGMDTDGIKTIDKFGNIIETRDGAVQVTSMGDIVATCASNATITAKNAKVTADVIEADSLDVRLGKPAPDSPVVRWNELQPWLDAHTHLTAFGPSSPAAAGIGPVPSVAASLTTKVK